MATSGPLGWNMPTEPDTVFSCNGREVVLGLRHYGQILLGVCESLWYAAIKGVHHRDISLGNIMWTWIEEVPGDPSSGRAVGYLVDFGNARYRDNPRFEYEYEDENKIENQGDLEVELRDDWDSYVLTLDDSRSGTPVFSSVHTVRTKDFCKWYPEDKKSLVDAAKSDYELRKTISKENYQQTLLGLKVDSHRYIDDLESVVYAFLLQVSPNEGTPFSGPNNRAADWVASFSLSLLFEFSVTVTPTTQMSWISGIDDDKAFVLKGLKDKAEKETLWRSMSVSFPFRISIPRLSCPAHALFGE
jgi:serine/threonine protein kinase